MTWVRVLFGAKIAKRLLLIFSNADWVRKETGITLMYDSRSHSYLFLYRLNPEISISGISLRQSSRFTRVRMVLDSPGISEM